MKLYELKRGQRFRLEEDAKTPPDARTVSKTQEFTLRNIDGMYSYCTDDYGRVVHPAAWTEVSVIEQEDLGYATVWHEGSKSFYHAKLIRQMSPQEVNKETAAAAAEIGRELETNH